MTENFDSTIKSHEIELADLIEKMEEIRIQFIDATAVFASNWFDDTTRKYVTSDTENTLKLGKEKIGELKAKVRKLSSQASQFSEEALSTKELWWHLSLKEMGVLSPYCCSGNRDPEIVNKGVRRVVGKLGPILSEYGFLRHEDCWLEHTSKCHGQKVIPYYPYGLIWSQEMRSIMKQYSEIYKQAYTKYKEIVNLKVQKQTEQAIEIWNST
ncbi:MAG: hypothetical protein ACQCN5_07195 [Candidatus Bathyarchaeia archaeon]|jgi:hypothetical protein